MTVIFLVIAFLFLILNFMIDSLTFGNIISLTMALLAILSFAVSRYKDKKAAKKEYNQQQAIRLEIEKRDQREAQKNKDMMLSFEKDIVQMKIDLEKLRTDKVGREMCTYMHESSERMIKEFGEKFTEVGKKIDDNYKNLTSLIFDTLKEANKK